MADPGGERPAKPGLRRPLPVGRATTGELVDRERSALAELAEVERSLAALEGRDVDNAEQNVAALRDAERRRGELENVVTGARAAIGARRKRLLYKVVVIGVGFLALGVAAARAWPSYKADMQRRALAGAAAAEVAEPFRKMGFASRDTATGSVQVPGEAGRCFLVAGASALGPVRLRAERELVVAEGDASIAWCSCGPAPVRVTAPGDPTASLVVVVAPASAVGGADQLGALSPRPGAHFAEPVDRACAEGAFDAWLGSRRPPPSPPPSPTTVEKRLVAFGLTARDAVPEHRQFLSFPEDSDQCVLVRARTEGTKLSLRAKGGERPIRDASTAIATCARSGAELSVWRDGGGEIVAFSAPAARVGGSLGLAELAARAGVPVTIWVPSADVAFDAGAALEGSGIPESTVLGAAGDLAAASVYAISSDAGGTLSPEESGARVACRPALRKGAIASLCLGAQPGAWASPIGMPPGALAVRRPIWIPVDIPATAALSAADRAQLDRLLEALAFSRRMSQLGFRLSTFESVLATPDGAQVTGRANEKEIVAVGVSPTAPTIFPLTEGPSWTPDGPPRVIPLEPGKTVRLRAIPGYTGPKREIWVWRR